MQINKLTTILKKILLILASLVLSYALGELLVYSLYKDKTVFFPRYVSDVAYGNFKIRRNIPNAHYYHKSIDGIWEFSINNRGFRNFKEFGYTKPKNTIRILTLGDSFTLGFEVRQDKTFSAVLENYLKRKGLNVEVINSGVSGFGNAEELVFFEQEGIKYQPHVVILGFFQNDLSDNIRSDLYRIVNNKLVLNKKEYLPAIKIRNFLNSFSLYRWLSENSYSHNYLNMNATIFFKNRLKNKILKNLSKSSNTSASDTASNKNSYKNKLAIALIKRIYTIAQQKDIYFILLDIPSEKLEPSIPALPSSEYTNSCDWFFNSSKILKGYQDLIDLNVPHGHGHWSEFSHILVGKELGEKLFERFGVQWMQIASRNNETT